MYFYSRAEAGQKLAADLLQYRDQNCAVIALGNGGIAVGEQVAISLHATLAVLLIEDIELPGERLTVGSVSQDGGFVYNSQFSSGETEEYYSEFRGYIEDQKREKFAKINRLLTQGGFVDIHTLKERTIIMVSDGFMTGTSLDAAMQFLKPIKLKRLIIATPVASVQAVDRMHILADELHCLSVTDNYINTNHYYDIHEVPSREEVIKKIDHIAENWL